MILKVLSSQHYKDTTKDYGDCFVFIDGKTAIVYDCGSEDHALRVISILDEYNIDKATVILSHNDDDHFAGIPLLISKGKVDKLFTILLLKYKNELLDEIDDGRINRNSIGNKITELYDNIASLSKTVSLKDVYENEDELPSQMEFVGPDFDYMIKAAAKGLDNREGDTIDGETITNAASVQIKLKLGTKKVLLTGDCTPDAFPEGIKLNSYQYIQLPHHGKPSSAKEIFKMAFPDAGITYLVSDNKGNANGGSDDLDTTGHIVENTKYKDIVITENAEPKTSLCTGRTLGQ